MFELLAKEIGWLDTNVIDFFRKGAPLFGKLELTGIGTKKDTVKSEACDPSLLFKDLETRNAKVHFLLRCCLSCHVRCVDMQVLTKLRQDELSSELVKTAKAECVMGRLRGPIQLDKLDLSRCAIATRFGVDQGMQTFCFHV